MQRNLRRKLALAALTLTLIPAAVLAARPRVAPPGPPGLLAQRLIHRLELTPEQLQAIRAVFAAHRQELQGEVAGIADSRRALFAAIHGETFDESAVREAATAVGAAEAELAVTRATIVQEVREVLTDEQEAELAEILAEARDRLEDLLALVLDRLENPLL